MKITIYGWSTRSTATGRWRHQRPRAARQGPPISVATQPGQTALTRMGSDRHLPPGRDERMSQVRLPVGSPRGVGPTSDAWFGFALGCGCG
jgi:hypothetical protein